MTSKFKVLQLSGLPAAQQARLEADYQVLTPPASGEAESWFAEHAADLRAVVTSGHLGIDAGTVARLPQLGLVAVNGVGYDQIDLSLAKSRGFAVTNTPDVLTDDVADLAIALMLNVMRALPEADRYVRAGEWLKAPMPLARRASGLRYGIVGLGRIGLAIANRLAGFGGTIGYTSRSRKEVPHAFHETLVELANWADVLFVVVPAFAATRNLIDRAVLDALGPQGVLVNVARGVVVDEPELVAALRDGRLGAAALDVFANEPNVPEGLLASPNVVVAPHVGSATVETRAAMAQLVLDNVAAFFAGRALLTPVS